MQKPSVTVSEDVTPGAKSGGIGDAAVKKAEEAGKDSEEASAKETDNVPTTEPTKEPVKVPTVTITAEPTPEESAEPTKKPEKEAAEKSAESTKKPEKEAAEESAEPTKKPEKEAAEESAEPTKKPEKEVVEESVEPTPEPDNKVYKYCCASVDATLRDIPSRSGNALAKIQYNEKVEILGSEGEFCYVSYNGQNGYVLDQFLDSNPYPQKNYSDGSKSESGNQNQNADSTMYCRASQFVTLRESASTSSAELDRVPTGAAVTVISSVGEWYYVEYNGTHGYVKAKFIFSDPNAPLVYDPR